MPSRAGVAVSVVARRRDGGQALTEYGTTLVGMRLRSELLESRIEAKHDQIFYINIKSESPFPFDPREVGDGIPERSSNAGPNKELSRSAKYPPFDLKVSVFINGREEKECETILYLNQEDSRYKPDGATMRGRPVEGEGGRTDSCYWIFSDLGIDELMDSLHVRAVEQDSMSNLANEFKSSVSTQLKPGKIEVQVARVYTVSMIPGGQSRRHGGVDEAVSGTNNGPDVTHTMVLGAPRATETEYYYVDWFPYKKKEGSHVRFCFLYMDRLRLVRFGYCFPTGLPTLTGRITVPDRSTHDASARKRLGEDIDSYNDHNATLKRSRVQLHEDGTGF